jgi:tRNA pseudouridine38-40 synthase
MTIEADGYLYNMVRNIAGSLAEIGKGVHEPSWIQSVLQAGDRRFAGPTAPAQGLFLVSVGF